MTPAAIVFDFDGVIANSEPLHLRAFQDVLAPAGLPLTASDYYARYLGYDDEGLMDALTSDRGVDLAPARRAALLEVKGRRLGELLRQPDVIFPGAADCIRTLAARLPLAIASGALRAEIELVLDAAGLRACFHDIVAAGDTPAGKPAPDPYLRALALLQARGLVPAGPDAARRTVAIEDSHFGLAAARAAGFRTVALATSHPAADLGLADLVLPAIDAVTFEAVARLVNEA
jgi:beta-phosphoglucomutase